MHFPGHNLTGPGTKLYKRLNPDGTPKEWSIPIVRVDAKTMNEVCDKTMFGELSGIVNPTLMEN